LSELGLYIVSITQTCKYLKLQIYYIRYNAGIVPNISLHFQTVMGTGSHFDFGTKFERKKQGEKPQI